MICLNVKLKKNKKPRFLVLKNSDDESTVKPSWLKKTPQPLPGILKSTQLHDILMCVTGYEKQVATRVQMSTHQMRGYLMED